MGTPSAPGFYDCDADQLPEEPGFKLLARDPDAGAVVKFWASLRAVRVASGMVPTEDMRKVNEALTVADQMPVWRAKNYGVWRNPVR